MTPQRTIRLLENQSAIARKVFEVVPIQEPWSSQMIFGELKKQHNTSADFHAIQGCLADLKAQGLIREVSRLRFQRYPVTQPKMGDLIREAQEAQKTTEQTPPQKEAATVNAIVATPGKPVDPLSRLATLAQKVRDTAAVHQAAMNELADGIEEVALSIEAEREVNAKSMESFHQLKGLLKVIGADGD